MSSCIFCRISSEETRANIVFNDEGTCAFLDTYPLARGHTLVIPKRHVELLEELSLSETQHLFATVLRLLGAIKSAVKASATTIAINNGRESGQEEPHVHVHIIPRTMGDKGGAIHSIMSYRPQLKSIEMEEIAKTIRNLVSRPQKE